MAFIKEEREDVKIEETFRVKYEETEEQIDQKRLKEENEIKEEDEYTNHHDFKSEEKPLSCSPTETTSAQKSAQRTDSVRPFTCQECGKCMTHRGSISRHMRIHTGEKPFTRRFHQHGSLRSHTGENLDSHVSVPTDASPHTCQHCGKSFSRKRSLEHHRRAHTVEKPYTCPQCGMSFNKKTKFEYHVRNHTREKPYRCPQCGNAFIQKGHVVDHIRIHTGEKPFTCQQCGNSFRQKGSLNRHVRTHVCEKLGEHREHIAPANIADV